jgi:hypothetical protein
VERAASEDRVMKKPTALQIAVAEKLSKMKYELDLEEEQCGGNFEPVLDSADEPGGVEAFWARQNSVEAAVAEAWRGNIEPLKRKFPDAAPFMSPPLPRKRKNVFKQMPHDTLFLVARDVKRIRDYWWEHYHEQLRHKKHGTTAIEIAIARWDDGSDQYQTEITVDAVEAQLKPSGPSGKKRPKK